MADYITAKVPCFEGGRGNSSFPCSKQDVARLSKLFSTLTVKGEVEVPKLRVYKADFKQFVCCVTNNKNKFLT